MKNPPQPGQPNPYVVKVLDLSIKHLPKGERRFLRFFNTLFCHNWRCLNVPPVEVAAFSTRYPREATLKGYYVSVPKDPDDFRYKRYLPFNLLEILKLTKQSECEVVRLSCHGKVFLSLPTF